MGSTPGPAGSRASKREPRAEGDAAGAAPALTWIGTVCDVAGAPAVESVVPSSGRDAIPLDDVVFAVIGTSREDVQAVARAVCDVCNRWSTARLPGLAEPERFVRGRGDWATARSPLAGSYYVYGYPEGERVFYVGKGTGARWLEHQQEVERLRACSVPVREMSAKQRTIHSILDASEERTTPLPRLIAEFTGNCAEAQALAVENFLIRRVYGPFNLTNDTIGNSNFGNELRWLSRPGPDLAERPLWASALASFFSQGRMRQTGNFDLRWMLVSPLVDLLKARVQGEAIAELQFVGSGNKRTDVAAEWNIAGTPALIQLVFGNKKATARINLRPRVPAWRRQPSADDQRAFKALVARAFGADAAGDIKVPDGSGCYFKPYRQGRRADTEFSYADDQALSRIEVAWSEAAEIGLIRAMQLVIGRLRAASSGAPS